jgi:hypothetical protein
MHKRQGEITPITPKTLTYKMPKKEIVWGMEKKMRSTEVYIASVGSPSGWSIYIVQTRAALGTCGHVAHVRTVLLTVRPDSNRSRPDSKRVSSGPLIRPEVNRDRPNASH